MQITDEPTDDILFEAVIVPRRSLSERGMRRLLAVIVAACLVSGGVSVSLGAWPVGGFAGLELLLAALLFRLHARAARGSELLFLSPASLRIVRTDARGRHQERILAPGWLGAELVERPGRVPQLLLVSRGQREEIGATLGEAEKRDLARALRAALDRRRHPVFDNPQLRDER